MANRIVIPFGSEVLVLSDQEFARARERGRAIVEEDEAAPTTPAPSEELIDASELASRLNLAKSAVYEHARSGRLPSVRIGRHVRFNLAAVLAALRRSGNGSSGP